MLRIFAYLDAGTGSLVIQAIAGVAATVLVFVKGFGHKIRQLFSFKSKKRADSASE